MTYAEFKAYITGFLWREGDAVLENAMDTLIKMAENRLNRDLKTQDGLAVHVETLAQSYITNPADFRAPDYIWCDACNASLHYITPYEFVRRPIPSGGIGDWYTVIKSTIHIAGHIGDQDGQLQPTITMVYFRQIPSYQATDASWVADRHLDLFTYAVLMHAGRFVRDDFRVPLWQNAYDDAMASVMVEDDYQRTPKGAPLRSRESQNTRII